MKTNFQNEFQLYSFSPVCYLLILSPMEAVMVKSMNIGSDARFQIPVLLTTNIVSTKPQFLQVQQHFLPNRVVLWIQ